MIFNHFILFIDANISNKIKLKLNCIMVNCRLSIYAKIIHNYRI